MPDYRAWGAGPSRGRQLRFELAQERHAALDFLIGHVPAKVPAGSLISAGVPRPRPAQV